MLPISFTVLNSAQHTLGQVLRTVHIVPCILTDKPLLQEPFPYARRTFPFPLILSLHFSSFSSASFSLFFQPTPSRTGKDAIWRFVMDDHISDTSSVEPSSSWVAVTDCCTISRPANKPPSLLFSTRINSIPLTAIGFLDLANSGDFAANIFNEIPVPKYAVALMTIGATCALAMSLVAFADARTSWRNMKLLREERHALLACIPKAETEARTCANIDGDGGGDADDAEPRIHADADAEAGTYLQSAHHRSLVIALDINHRDFWSDLLDRGGMEVLMGVAAFLIAVGTYMAIGGANHTVYMTSNLLSGYIGNAPPAAYGVVSTGWSLYVCRRTGRQLRAAEKGLEDQDVLRAFKSRAKVVREHAVVSGITCLVSGAMSMLTPTRWWPYPILLVCGLTFIYGNQVYRRRIGYARSRLLPTVRVDKEVILRELAFVDSVKRAIRREFRQEMQEKRKQPELNLESLHPLLEMIVRCDLFVDLCELLLQDGRLMDLLFGKHESDQLHVTPFDMLGLPEDEHGRVVDVARRCLEDRGPRQLSYRRRFLLEALGSCLASGSGSLSEKT